MRWSIPTLSHAFAVTPIQLILGWSSVLAILPPDLAVCLRVGVWGKRGTTQKAFRPSKARSFIFIPRTNQVGLQVADILAEGVNSPFQPLFTHFEEGIIANSFIPARSAGQRSDAVTMTRRIVAGGLVLNQGAPYFRYSSKNAFSFPNGMISI